MYLSLSKFRFYTQLTISLGGLLALWAITTVQPTRYEAARNPTARNENAGALLRTADQTPAFDALYQ